MSEHTPGPWVSTYADSDDGQDPDNGRYVTSVRGVLIADAYPDTWLDLSLPESMDVARANARLIAKAPAMYELLKDTVRQWGSMIDNDEDINGDDAVEWLGDFIAEARAVLDPP